MQGKRKYLLLVIIIVSTILISGCYNIIFGPSGSIEVTTSLSGAKIFLDGKDTGKITPYTLKNVSAGNHIIEVAISDMKETEIVEVKSYQTTQVYIEFYSQATLLKINVLPPTINITLSLGNTFTISSVTAYYSDYSSTNIPLTNCTYNSNDACATVNSSGVITGISAGAAIITVSYTEGGITKTDTVLVYIRNTPEDIPLIPSVEEDIVYRALLVGVGNYENDDGVNLTDLNAPPYDVNRMHQVLEQCKFGSSETEFSSIVELKDLSATKTNILNEIDSTFSDADENDISYFYFSGHGYYDTDNNLSYICPTDAALVIDLNTMISVDELESHLSVIPGTKVVLLDSCFSGGFIGKGKDYLIDKDWLVAFNNNIVNTFSLSQAKNLLTANQFKVLTSCHYYQTCSEFSPHPIDGNPFGWFSAALCEGCGYNSFIFPYPADNDKNSKVSLQEAYLYVESTLEPLEQQDVQVFPTNSTFTIVE